jgi:hypothetical protein
LEKEGVAPQTTTRNESCVLACCGESAPRVPPVKRATAGWKESCPSDKPAGFSPGRFFPHWLTPFSTTSTEPRLTLPGSTPNFLYPVIRYETVFSRCSSAPLHGVPDTAQADRKTSGQFSRRNPGRCGKGSDTGNARRSTSGLKGQKRPAA